MSNNVQELCDIAIDMAKGMNMVSEHYNALISIEEKVINLQKVINDISSKSYISQNLLEKCFERLGEMIMRTDDVSSISSETKHINKVGLDMSSYSRKGRQQQLLITLGQKIYHCLRTKISEKVFRKCLSFKRIKA